MKLLLPRLLFVSTLLAAPIVRAAELLADVVVYGATEAGCAAAMAAAREGASVILLTPDQHLGGMATSGRCALDLRPFQSGVLAGLGREWALRVQADPRQKDFIQRAKTRLAYEPQTALRVTRQMLDDAGVLLLAGRRLQAVALDGPRLQRLHTSEGDFKGKVFIDATCEGDLAAMCGIPLLSSQAPDPDPPAATEGLPPLAPTGPELPVPATPGPMEETLPFELCLSTGKSQPLPLPSPASMDTLALDTLRQWLADPSDPMPFWSMEPLPGEKLAVRFDLTGPLVAYFQSDQRWCDLAAKSRAALWEEQRQRMLALCAFLASDPAVPETWRKQWSTLGLANDEFPGNAHWPPLLPLKAGRRMQGAWVLTATEAAASAGEPEAVAWCAESLADETANRPWPVPFRALLPAMIQCENLLAPSTPSCGHPVAAALQTGSMPMALGQAAGIAAALACQAEAVLPLHGLAYPALRDRLRAQGVVLNPPATANTAPAAETAPVPTLPGLLLDDDDAELQGRWQRSTHLQPFWGKAYLHDGRGAKGGCKAVFRFQVEESASYDLRLAYTAERNRATNVPVTIETGGRKAKLLFDQTRAPLAGTPFRSLAVVELQAGVSVTVTLSNQGADGYVVVDGLQVLRQQNTR